MCRRVVSHSPNGWSRVYSPRRCQGDSLTQKDSRIHLRNAAHCSGVGVGWFGHCRVDVALHSPFIRVSGIDRPSIVASSAMVMTCNHMRHSFACRITRGANGRWLNSSMSDLSCTRCNSGYQANSIHNDPCNARSRDRMCRSHPSAKYFMGCAVFSIMGDVYPDAICRELRVWRMSLDVSSSHRRA